MVGWRTMSPHEFYTHDQSNPEPGMTEAGPAPWHFKNLQSQEQKDKVKGSVEVQAETLIRVYYGIHDTSVSLRSLILMTDAG